MNNKKHTVIVNPHHHCERSEAISSYAEYNARDCFGLCPRNDEVETARNEAHPHKRKKKQHQNSVYLLIN